MFASDPLARYHIPMKRSELIVAVLLVPLDFLGLLLAAWTALSIRKLPLVTGLRPVLFEIPIATYFRDSAVVAVVWIIIFALLGLYNHRVTDTAGLQLYKVFAGTSAGLVAITMLVFLRGELFSSRFIILAAWAIAIVYVSVLRILVLKLERIAFRRGFAAHRVIVVGSGHAAQSLAERIRQQPELGYRIVGMLPADSGGLAAIRQAHTDDQVDEILFVDDGEVRDQRQQFLDLAEEEHIAFRYAPDVMHSPLGTVVIDFDLGLPIIEVAETTLQGWGRVTKRSLDLSGSIFFLIIFSPVMLIVAIAIWLETGRPIIFKATRVARGKLFVFLKFRSMYVKDSIGAQYGGAEADALYEKLIQAQSIRQGPVPKVIDDPRVTRVGKWIRRTSLDELPQLWNVLRGDMSLVGPRPHFPKEVANYERHHKKVLAIKPGITGLAQVSGRSDLDFEDEVRLDRYYIEHWSPWLDIQILAKTVLVIFQKRVSL